MDPYTLMLELENVGFKNHDAKVGLCVQLYMRTCMCVRVDMCTCGRVYVYVCMCVRVYVHVCTRVHVCPCVRVYLCLFVCLYMCSCVRVFVCRVYEVRVYVCACHVSNRVLYDNIAQCVASLHLLINVSSKIFRPYKSAAAKSEANSTQLISSS
jgi:hypothetical protein